MIKIHSSAFVADDVEIGSGTIVGPNAVILSPCSIGTNCWIGPNTVIGTPAQDIEMMQLKRIPEYYDRENLSDNGYLEEYLWNTSQGLGVVIGNNTIVREGTAIHQGTVRETEIGDNVFLMHNVHIGHDVYVGDHVTMAPMTVIAGYCSIFEMANLGMGTIVHQRIKIGAGSMIGMNSTLTKNTGPFEKWYGTPARNNGTNVIALEKMEYSDNDIQAIKRYHKNGKKTPKFMVKYIDELEEA